VVNVIKEFGIAGWFGTLIIIGSFVIIGMGVVRGHISFDALLPALTSWVGSVVTAYFVVKGIKTGKEQ